jgi:hypothetical protein
MSAFAQTLEQIVETWPSTTYQTTATKLKVQHLNDDLEVVKEEYFDPNGLKVASYNIDPVTKKFHGDFFDGTNKGSYNQGILTANNFRLILEKPTSEVVFNVKDGIIQGKLIKTVAWRGNSKIDYIKLVRNYSYIPTMTKIFVTEHFVELLKNLNPLNSIINKIKKNNK